MTTLALSEPGLRLAVRDQSFVVEQDHRPLQRAPIAEVDRILLLAGVDLTAAAIRVVLDRGIDLCFLRADGRYRGRLQGPRARNVRLRVLQAHRCLQPATRLAFAERFVRAKIHNQRTVLLRLQRRHPDERLGRVLGQLQQWQDRPPAADADGLRGLEGAAAAAYFEGFGVALRHPEFSFTGRTRRPPRDPVNACLSFGYAMLASFAVGVCERVGLDPMVGCLHELDYGRPSLALDLIEEWRPVLVDAVVLRLFHRRQLVPRDFGPPEKDVLEEHLAGLEPEPVVTDAVFLRPTGRKIVISEFLKRMRERAFVPERGTVHAYGDIMEIQAHRLARDLEQGLVTYEGFRSR